MERLLSTEVVGREAPGLAALVWVKGATSTIDLARLATSLQPEFRVHRGEAPPPQADPPSAVVCCLVDEEDDEGVASAVRHAKATAPGAAVLVLAPSVELALVRAAVSAGARGFHSAGAPPGQLSRALLVVLSGEMALPRGLLAAYLEWLDEPRRLVFSTLSKRQLEIVELVAEGLSNAQIAKKLFISESTVKQHLSATYKVLGAKNRREASRIVYQVQHQPGWEAEK